MTGPSPSVEEYLENIYGLQERDGIARTKQLAVKMRVTLGTVTNTVEMLERQGFVTHKPYRGIKLTEKGRRIALDVKRRHRLAERFLTDILRMDSSIVHEVACRLEHGLTEEVTKPLGKILGHPKTCPHGNPIPTRCGGIIEEGSKPLIDLQPQERALVVKIVDENRDLLQRLRSLGIVVGAYVKVEKKARFDRSLVVTLKDAKCRITRGMASAIWVRKE